MNAKVGIIKNSYGYTREGRLNIEFITSSASFLQASIWQFLCSGRQKGYP